MNDELSEQTSETQPIEVASVLAIFIDQLAGIAWQKLGLQVDPMTNAVHKDLVEAQFAIDILADMITRLEPKIDENDRRQVQTLLRDLRINFVNQSK